MQYPIATIGTVIVILVAFAAERLGVFAINRRTRDRQQRYSRRGNLRVAVSIIAGVAVALLWIRLFHNKGTFFGLLGAGLAVALREPLLSIAGRLSIWLGHMYRVGDRIEFSHMAGDVISIGTFYTRMLEIGNWIHGDQATGRIIQFPNSSVYQNPVYNYTQNFSFVWDEVQLPVTYASDIKAATAILTEVGGEYTRDFLQNAESQIAALRNVFFMPDLTLEPAVFTVVTSNYVELTMRYLVDPRKRRAAKSYLYTHILEQVQGNSAIQFGSDTMDLTVHPPEKKTA